MAKYGGTKTLEVLEGADNYNKWIARTIAPYIVSPALEIGAGIGNISSYFSKLHELVVTDNDPELVSLLRGKFSKNKNVHVELFDIAKKLGTIHQRFEAVYSVNVLEHIENDGFALSNMFKLLKSGGRVVVLVPAKKGAYTKLDANLGHFRRYEKNEISSKLTAAGFKLEKVEYFNIVGLLSWILRNAISRNHNDLKKSQVKIFDILVPLLKTIEPQKGLPIGISLIAVGRKA